MRSSSLKKIKTIRQLDQRPNLRNEIRAADQLITKQTTLGFPTGPTIGGGGGVGGPGQDGTIIGGPCATIETFTRTQEGLGTSEFGPEWIFTDLHTGINTPLHSSVNGTEAWFRADEPSQTNGEYSVELWQNGPTLPIETLTK